MPSNKAYEARLENPSILVLLRKDRKRAFRAVWEAATLEEREACAKLCESLPVTDDDVADECAAAIRARSNAEVTGLGRNRSNDD